MRNGTPAMSQRSRPQGLKLRKVTGMERPAREDIGSLHVIDYWLHWATKDLISVPRYGYAAQRIGRYLDGEEEREGTYR